jgi:predicted metal-dependent phosphoesterase TrpH
VAEQARLRGRARPSGWRAITEKMDADGYPVDVESVFALVPEGASAGRPHLARALVAAGVVESVKRGVRHAAAQRQPLLRAQDRHPVERAIAMVRAGGGGGVRAPARPPRGRVVEPSVIADLAAVGLGGVEVDHPDHTPQTASSCASSPPSTARHHRLQRLPRHEQDHPVAREHTAPTRSTRLSPGRPGSRCSFG